MARIEAAAKPWTAAIHGSALGGGFEVALGCRFRVAVPTAVVGLPEVTLGVMPGAGGTVRLPRLVAPEVAVEIVTTGKPVKAPEALDLGLVDAVVTGDLRAEAIAFARGRTPAAGADPERTPLAAGPGFWEAAEKAVAKRAKGEAAPLRALASLRKATEADFETAMAFEREGFLALRGSPEAAALRAVFFAERAAPRPQR